MVVSSWGDAALHSRWWLVAQYGRVGTTHHCAARFGWATSQEPPTSHRLVGANSGRLEREADALCLEWQAQATARTRADTPSGRIERCSDSRVFNCKLTH